jgi:hypothetical protein
VGRGLSELQRYILAEAGKRQTLGQLRKVPDNRFRDSRFDLYVGEILHGYFGWKPHYPIRLKSDERDIGYHFSRREIGEATYRKTMTTLSRSIRRLEERGLVEYVKGYSWTAVVITPTGRQELYRLTQSPNGTRLTDSQAQRGTP